MDITQIWQAIVNCYLKNFDEYGKMFHRIFFLSDFSFTDTGQQGKGGHFPLFHYATSIRSRTFRQLFATLHVR